MNKNKLYNNILVKSRNINLFIHLEENLDNKIILLLIHFSFIFNKLKIYSNNKSQKIFDYIFLRIETDLREIAMGDMMINKKMKIIINKFYHILISFDQYLSKNYENKCKLLSNLLIFQVKRKKNCKEVIEHLDNFAKAIDLFTVNDIYSGNIL